MSVLPLTFEPKPILRQVTVAIKKFDKTLLPLSRDMIDTMYANEGIGLAAPQIGHSISMFVANPLQERGKEIIVINPVIEKMTGHTSVVEGCLSIPKVWERVRRATHIRISGHDLSGKRLVFEAKGLMAIVLQHECDHLQGKLFIDRLPWYQKGKLRIKRAFKK